MLKKWYRANWLGLAWVFVVLGAQLGLATPLVGVIDSRFLLMVHPLFRTLDPETRRFAGATAPSTSVADENKRLTADLAETRKLIEAGFAALKSAMAKARTPEERRSAENAYWTTRRAAEKKVESLQERLAVLARALPAPDGGAQTPRDVLLKPLLQIDEDIRSAVGRAAAARRVAVVIDEAALLPQAPPAAFEPSILHSTALEEILTGRNPAKVGLLPQWLAQARLYWHQRLPGAVSRPVHGPVVDLRFEAARILLEQVRDSREKTR